MARELFVPKTVPSEAVMFASYTFLAGFALSDFKRSMPSMISKCSISSLGPIL